MSAYSKYPEAYYRVSVKAVIKNEVGEVLCVKEGESMLWELPGGGINHGEDLQQALARELQEELAYEGGLSYTMLDSIILHDPSRDTVLLFLITDVTLHDTYVAVPGVDTTEVAWLHPQQFKLSDARAEQMIYRAAVDMAYPIAFTR